MAFYGSAGHGANAASVILYSSYQCKLGRIWQAGPARNRGRYCAATRRV